MTFHQFLCRIGWHKWQQSRPLGAMDATPIDQHYVPLTRTCKCCGQINWWLPGYGGSEVGSWIRWPVHSVNSLPERTRHLSAEPE